MRAAGIKRQLALALLVSQAVFFGCAHQYLMTLRDGAKIISISKPKHQGTSYRFTDQTGEEHVIPQDRVLKIQTGAAGTQEQKPPPPAAKPKKPKHWYFLWLA